MFFHSPLLSSLYKGRVNITGPTSSKTNAATSFRILSRAVGEFNFKVGALNEIKAAGRCAAFCARRFVTLGACILVVHFMWCGTLQVENSII